MKNPSKFPTTLLKSFPSIEAISKSPIYSEALEYSDKLILPRSIFFTIRALHYPIPPVFILRNSKIMSKSVYCGVLEFSSSDNQIFAPQWIIRRLSSSNKYSSFEVRLEIVQTPQTKSSLFPFLTRVDLVLVPDSESDLSLDLDSIKKNLMMYTVITKGDYLNVFYKNSNKVKVYVCGLLPRNRCVIKSNGFDLNFVVKQAQTTVTEEDDRLSQAELMRISYVSKSRVLDRRKESATPWEHRIRPMKIEGDVINLLPWGNEGETGEQENMVDQVIQTLPEIANASRKGNESRSKRKKILSFAFPQVSLLDLRPLTTVNKENKHKSISFSPISRV